MAAAAELHRALVRIANTPDGKLLFGELQRHRLAAFEAMKVATGEQLLRAQGSWMIISTLFGHDDLTTGVPK